MLPRWLPIKSSPAFHLHLNLDQVSRTSNELGCSTSRQATQHCLPDQQTITTTVCKKVIIHRHQLTTTIL